MTFNKYSVYSAVSATESSGKNDLTKTLRQLEKLKRFNNAEEVKNWLKENWQIENEVSNFNVAKNISITTTTGNKYFNVTVKEEKKIKTYNFTKETKKGAI